MIIYDGIGACEVNSPMTVKLFKDGTQVGQTLTYSIADYVKALLSLDATGNSTLSKQQTLVERLYAYGLSAEAYNDSTRQVFIKNQASDYVIVYDDAASESVVAIAYELSELIAEKTGVTLPVVKDSTPAVDKEILVGSMNGRAESVNVAGDLLSTDPNGCRVCLSGNKLVIVSGSENRLRYATSRFVDALSTHGGTSWSVPLDYSLYISLPVTTIASSTSSEIFYAGESNYTHSYFFNSTNISSQYAQYIASLKAEGFEEYATNTIGSSTFGTYVSTDRANNTVVYTMCYPNTKNIRVTYGPLGYLPENGGVNMPSSALLTHPSIVFNARETSYAGASGLALVIQLLDGSFILVDGGSADGSIATKYKDENGDWITNDAKVTEDAKKLYDLLVSLTPNGQKPEIALWHITHAHGDHIGMSNQFLATYCDQIDVKAVAYNYPDFDTITLSWDGASGTATMGRLAKTFERRIRSYYPGADIWVLHTGETMSLPGCEVEVLCTAEDYYGYSSNACDFGSGNDTCSVLRLTFGKTTMIVTGDCPDGQLNRMVSNFGDALESDILQITHHGSNGATPSFYQAVDPKVCLWPIDSYNFENGKYQLGSSTGSGYMYANWWIRNTEWTRDDGTSGERTHYNTSISENQVIETPNSMIGDIVIQTPTMPLGDEE